MDNPWSTSDIHSLNGKKTISQKQMALQNPTEMVVTPL